MFPYYSKKGRYHFNFFAAHQACQDQEATLATVEQLFSAWEDGLDWCNAGWLSDGTAQYPITVPRHGCGGEDLAPGLRSYGRRHRLLNLYDAFCFSASTKGECEHVTVVLLTPSLTVLFRSRECLLLKRPEEAQLHSSSPGLC